MEIFVALVVGSLFGIGLLVSGMVDPSKVLGFLDLAGEWDPSLALVMAGAVLVGAIAFGLAANRSRTLLGGVMRLPAATAIDRRLVLGSAVFGVGWGLAGYCPGPAFASLLLDEAKTLAFVLSLIAGMGIFEAVNLRSAWRSGHPT